MVYILVLKVHSGQDALETDVHAVVAADVPPEFGAFHVFGAAKIALPVVLERAHDAADLRVVVAVRIEQAALLLAGAQAQFEHVARLVGEIGLGAVPDA